MTRRLRAFRRLDRGSRRLVLEAAVALAAARLLVAAVPVHALARRLAGGREGGNGDGDGDAAEVARLVRLAARAMPHRAACLEQALAAMAMLRRRGVRAVLHLGTARGGAGFEAHAWLSVAGVVVLGGPVDRYAEIARY